MITRDYIQKLRDRLAAVEQQLSEPGITARQEAFQKLVAEHKHLKRTVDVADRFFRLEDEEAATTAILNDPATEPDMKQMAEEDLARISQEKPKAERALTVALLPPRPEDSRNTIIEIRAGTGGEEAALFAGDLFRMYTHFAEEQGWKVNIMDASPSAVGGYKEVIFAVEGEDVYRVLRYESGVHRVQRVPETEASGRIHTSAATVAVLPEAEDVDHIDIKPEEIRIDIFRSSGPGGQSVNTTDSAVRITHLPTGLIVQSQDERSQHRNREKAMRVLKARLLDRHRQEEAEKYASQRRSQVGTGDRSERIRTYNFPQNRLTDHRINLTVYSLDRIIEGDIKALTDALYEYDVAQRLENELKT